MAPKLDLDLMARIGMAGNLNAAQIMSTVHSALRHRMRPVINKRYDGILMGMFEDFEMIVRQLNGGTDLGRIKVGGWRGEKRGNYLSLSWMGNTISRSWRGCMINVRTDGKYSADVHASMCPQSLFFQLKKDFVKKLKEKIMSVIERR